MKKITLLAAITIAAQLAGCSHKPAPAEPSAETVFSNTSGPVNPLTQMTIGNSYRMTTTGDAPDRISLVVKDGKNFKSAGELEIKGLLYLGAEGLLAYADTFRRIRLSSDGDWIEIRRRAIRNGRLVIEVEQDHQVFTISRFDLSNRSAELERGIHVNS